MLNLRSRRPLQGPKERLPWFNGHQQGASGRGRGRQTKAPPQGSGARWVHLVSCHTGLADPSEIQQAHLPNAQPQRWLHSARGTRTKKPRRSGASWVHHGLPKCGAISVAPSPQRPPSSSILAGAATFWSRYGDALGVGASRCRLAQHGGNHGQRRQRLSAVLLYGIIRHGDCPRGREPAHLMQPLCLATLLGQCVQVRENVAGD